MAKRRNDGDSPLVTLLLVVVILGGMGYLAYDHWDQLKTLDIESLKQMVGLGEPPPTPTVASHPRPTMPPPSENPSPSAETAQSTNNSGAPVVPVIGKPRPTYPAQDHWTWTTSDGKTYNDVKIEKIQGDYVTIIHSDGGARVPISTLPDDLQKQLNYYNQ